jgi:prepilin-type N-terminal cleavage/methylation domain-containing protein
MIRKLRPCNEKGFTLIELMIVVAIIGILAAIAIPQFSAYRQRAYIASMKADCNAIRTAEEAYFVDNDTYLATAAPATDLASFGFKALSTGNSAAVVAGGSGTIAIGFKVTLSDATAGRTGKTVVYDSTLGTTVTE